jgi:hypothetical protein
MNTKYNKYIRERAIVEQWTRPDGYTISVRTYHFKGSKCYTVNLMSSIIYQYEGYAMEETQFPDPISRRLTAERAERFNANTMLALHDKAVTLEIINLIETLLATGPAVKEKIFK